MKAYNRTRFNLVFYRNSNNIAWQMLIGYQPISSKIRVISNQRGFTMSQSFQDDLYPDLVLFTQVVYRGLISCAKHRTLSLYELFILQQAASVLAAIDDHQEAI